jgi:DNA invertase Pin-like site-specific DNA recombinase
MQRNEVFRRCRERGWKPIISYEDRASGSSRSCKALDAMMRDVAAGRINRVIVYALDRLGRSTAHLMLLWERFSKARLHFISIRDNLDTEAGSASGEIIFNVMSSVASVERRRIVERINDGLKAAKKRGVVLGRPRKPGDLRAQVVALSCEIGIRAAARKLGVAASTACLFRQQAGVTAKKKKAKTSSLPVPPASPSV